MSDYQPLIIIGAARSGTKLIRDLVATSPTVDRVPYDVNYIWRLGNESLTHDEIPAQSLTPKIKGRISRSMNRYHRGLPILVEKTVSNCLRIPFVHAVYPDVKFIHLVRDGHDVIESSYRQLRSRPDWSYISKKALTFPYGEAFGYARRYAIQALRQSFRRDKSKGSGTWGPRYDGIDRDLANLDMLQVCALQWVKCLQKAAAGFTQISPDRVVTIRYEEFVRQPLKQLERIAYFASLDPKPYASSPELTKVSTSNIGKGRRNLSAEQLESISPLMEDTLAIWGYR